MRLYNSKEYSIESQPTLYLTLLDRKFWPLLMIPLVMVPNWIIVEAHTWPETIGGFLVAAIITIGLSPRKLYWIKRAIILNRPACDTWPTYRHRRRRGCVGKEQLPSALRCQAETNSSPPIRLIVGYDRLCSCRSVTISTVACVMSHSDSNRS